MIPRAKSRAGSPQAGSCAGMVQLIHDQLARPNSVSVTTPRTVRIDWTSFSGHFSTSAPSSLRWRPYCGVTTGARLR